MIEDVSMSGVILTKDINTGAPYYVINYDDETGRTDTVTAGTDYKNRSLYILRGQENSLESKRFINLIKSVKEIEKIFKSNEIDIEFALDKNNIVYIFQIRKITTYNYWDETLEKKIKKEIESIQIFLTKRFERIKNIYGKKSIFGQMPDWNPVEMIGRSPKALALSLYKFLITDHIWRDARLEMGYNIPIGMPLMISLSGVPYIDCRLSFNSFLPKGLPKKISEKIVNAWLKRLEKFQHLHDKIEFEIITSEFTFNFDEKIQSTIPNVLSENELNEFRKHIKKLTKDLILNKKASISDQLEKIKILERKNEKINSLKNYDLNILVSLLEDCKIYGTLPFSILARHGFIAQSILKSLVSKKIISVSEYENFLNNIKTVAGEIIEDTKKIKKNSFFYKKFIKRYGHLRPGTYNILSKRYDELGTTFFKNKKQLERKNPKKFRFNKNTLTKIQKKLNEINFEMTPDYLLSYCSDAIKAREYAKFVFTKNISDALKCIQKFGITLGMKPEELSHIPVTDFFSILNESYEGDLKKFLLSKSKFQSEKHSITSSLHLPHLICNKKDISVIPLIINRPNFITRKIISGRIVILNDNNKKIPNVENKIVVSESADPGYDWIFLRNIKGLVTKYGGSNSHMAIRCAEFSLPAAIGCGDQIFERIIKSVEIEINCIEGKIQAIL